MNVYIYAYDPKLGIRTVYVLKGQYAVSLATKHRFKLTRKELAKIRKKEAGK